MPNDMMYPQMNSMYPMGLNANSMPHPHLDMHKQPFRPYGVPQPSGFLQYNRSNDVGIPTATQNGHLEIKPSTISGAMYEPNGYIEKAMPDYGSRYKPISPENTGYSRSMRSSGESDSSDGSGNEAEIGGHTYGNDNVGEMPPNVDVHWIQQLSRQGRDYDENCYSHEQPAKKRRLDDLESSKPESQIPTYYENYGNANSHGMMGSSYSSYGMGMPPATTTYNQTSYSSMPYTSDSSLPMYCSNAQTMPTQNAY